MKVSKKLEVIMILMGILICAIVGLLIVLGGLNLAKKAHAVKCEENKTLVFTKEESDNLPPVCIERKRKSFSDKIQASCKEHEALVKGYCTIMVPRAALKVSRNLRTIKCKHQNKGKYFDKELTAVAVCCKYGSKH